MRVEVEQAVWCALQALCSSRLAKIEMGWRSQHCSCTAAKHSTGRGAACGQHSPLAGWHRLAACRLHVGRCHLRRCRGCGLQALLPLCCHECCLVVAQLRGLRGLCRCCGQPRHVETVGGHGHASKARHQARAVGEAHAVSKLAGAAAAALAPASRRSRLRASAAEVGALQQRGAGNSAQQQVGCVAVYALQCCIRRDPVIMCGGAVWWAEGPHLRKS
jgi:hypothetical protein